MLGLAVPAFGAGAVDLTTPGATATVNGAVFQQGPLASSAGTGVLDPFLQVKNTGQDADIEKGYNTDAEPQFDEQDVWTEALLLSTVPTRDVEGTLYRVLYLDVNQVNSVPLISLDELKLYLVGSPLVTNYDPATEQFNGVAYPKIYDLGDSWVKLDYSLEAGSGKSDMTALIPETLFAGAGPNCQYGQPGCTTWLSVWNKFGVNHPNNDGFEEWSTEILPFVQLSKTATGTFDRAYDWTIDKSGSPLAHNLFAGASGDTDYDIKVDQTVTDTNIKVMGTVTITVPAKLPDGDSDAPDAVITSLTDVFDQSGTKTSGTFSDCAVPFTVKAGASRVCTYTVTGLATAGAGVNTATAVVTGTPQAFTTTASVAAFTPTVTGFPTVNVTDQFGAEAAYALGSASGDTTFDDDRTFSCSEDPSKYTNGTYSYTVKNTATITETGQKDDVTVTVNCYGPVVTKDASTYWKRAWAWEITKDKDAAYDLFAGGSVTHPYKVSVVPTKTDDGWGVKGSIHVVNPHPTAKMTLTSVSDLAGGISAPVICPTLEVAAGATLTCTYDSGAQSSPNSNPFGSTNTATASFGGASWTGTAAIVFSSVPNSEKDPVITVDDDNLTGEDWEAASATSWEYTKDFACPSDPAAYIDGKYSYSLTNTATINETGQKDTAKVDVNCYAPVVSKTAAGTFDKTYTWTIDKTKDGEYWKFIGDPATTHGYKVAVDQTITPSDYKVSGVITVANPNPSAAMSVNLSDSLSSGELATLTDCTNPVTIPAGTSVDCKYTASPKDDTPGTNTATATLNKVDFTATKDYTFTAKVIGYPIINVTDTNGGLGSASGDQAWEYTKDFACPTDPAKYVDGAWSKTYDNTATIDETGQTASSSVTLHCYAPVVGKSADATFDRTWDWTIKKTGDQTALELAVGQSFLVNYEVTVSATKTDAGYEVTGKVTVTNANPMAAMDVKVADAIGGTAAIIDCGGGAGDDTLTVPAGVKASCDYKIDFGATKPASTTNVATVTFNALELKAEKAFTWSLDTETDECISVSDSKYGDLGIVCAGDSPKIFKYSMFVGPHEVCGTYQYKNTATFTTNDSGTKGSSSWTVDINIPCGGCTLTQGYWKTHSEFGPAPYDETWGLLDTWYSPDAGVTWIDGDGLYKGAGELFFSPLTGFSWHHVFWTAPAGNAYYQLAHQYQAAVLNILNEASAPSSVTDAIAHAEMLFKKYTPAQIGALKGNDKVRKDFISTSGILGSYNTGKTGPGHCDEDSLSSRTD
jgi:hypothetical protein